MKVSNSLWAEKLRGKLPEHLAREIDIFETEIALQKAGQARRAPVCRDAAATRNLRPAL